MFRLRMIALCAIAATGVIFGGCQQRLTTEKTAKVELGDVPYTIKGPHSHENLTVFLLYSDKEDESDYLTLEEGLKSGDVKIAEMERETVGTLQIENSSERPLYLQEGERLQGGRQDRVITASLVIPPKSGKTTVPSFCVEQHRWKEGDTGKDFVPTVNSALAQKGVRGAAKVEGSQHDVWKCVGATKATASLQLGTANSNSSVNEMLDDPKVQKLSEEYAKALHDAVTGPRAGDVVGVVIVVNDAIEEIDIYPNHKVLEKMYPRLLLSYALHATLLKDHADSAQAPQTIETVAKFLESKDEKSRSDKTIDKHNSLEVHELEDNKYQCSTKYDGKLVHWQIIKKMGDQPRGSSSASGSSRTERFGLGW